MYQVNDIVLYASQGVCKISEITQKSFNGKTVDYYVLKPVYDATSTIFIPAQNEASSSKIRRVLTIDEIYTLVKAVPAEYPEWIENESLRKAKFKEIMTAGDRTELIKLIKSLYLHQQQQKEKGRKLRISDELVFKNAEKLLYDEFALVLGIKPDQVLSFILEQINDKTPTEQVV